MKEYPCKVYKGYHPRILVTEEFVERHKLSLCRTPQEVLDYGNNHDSFMSFSKEILIHYMPPEISSAWIIEDKREEHINTPIRERDIYETTQDFLDYMVFGWMKALSERGISASRTIDKCATYMWLLGREDIENVLRDDSLYNPYGTPALIEACRMLAIAVPGDLIDFSANKR